MSFARPERSERRASLPLAPMLDVLFLLLIFFAVTSTFRAEERQIDVNLAATETGQYIEPSRSEIVINVKDDGTLIIGNRSVDGSEMNDLLRRLVQDFPDERVIVRGDKTVAYEHVLAVVDAARAAGVKNINLATVRRAEEAGG